MLSYKLLLNPFRGITIIFGVQWLLWLVFLPDTPTVANGEPKFYNIDSIFLFVIYFALLLTGVWVGSIPLRQKRNHLEPNLEYYLYIVGKIAFWLSLVVQFYRYFPLINMSTLNLYLSAFGANLVHKQIQENSATGTATLATLWIVAAVIFAQMSFLPNISEERKKRARWYVWALCVETFFISFFESTRATWIYFMLIVLGAWLLVQRPSIRANKVLISIMIALSFIWAGSMLRTGVAMAAKWNLSIVSSDVQIYIWNELSEKYLGGELNSAFILMSYPTDFTANWSYGTMFERFNGQSYIPPRYLNTLNALGMWYWQFGIWGGMITCVLTGFLLGKLHTYAVTSSGLSWASCYFLVSFPGYFGITRTNYFFLWTFVVPLTAFIFFRFISIFNLNPKHRTVISFNRTSPKQIELL